MGNNNTNLAIVDITEEQVINAHIESLILTSASGNIATGELVEIYQSITTKDEWHLHYRKDRYESKSWLTNGQMGKTGSTVDQLAGVDKIRLYIAKALLTDHGLWSDKLKNQGQYMPLVRKYIDDFENKRNVKIMRAVIVYTNMKSMISAEKTKAKAKALTVEPPAGSENSSTTEVIKTENESEVTENTMLGQLAMMQQDIAMHSEKSTKKELLESIAFYQEIVSMLIEKA